METQDFKVMDLNTGQPLILKDIFVDGFEIPLTNILTEKLRKMNNLPRTSKLSEHGFFVDEVIPNTNFYVTGTGIGFFYNHYEIAPYANGPTDIFLPFGELTDILKKTSPLNTLSPLR